MRTPTHCPTRSSRIRRARPLWRPLLSCLALGATLPVLRAAPATPAPAATATGTIRGRVENADTATYLRNARVRVVGTGEEVRTNSFGEYRLTHVPAGPVTLDVFYTGLSGNRVSVSVPANGSIEQDFALTSDPANGVTRLSTYVVQSQRETEAAAIAINEQRFAAARKDVVSTDAFGEINQGNIGEFVKFLPGITLDVKDGNTPSGIMVRGFDPNYTNVTLDGGQMASTIVANTQTSSRQFVLEGMNINNIARIEVAKLPTPEMSANLLGGAVNFISKSAFERVRPELRVSTYLSANAKAFDLHQTPGPFLDNTYKVLPSFDFQYANPVSKRFGYVVTAQQSSQFYLQNKSVIGHQFKSNGATLADPYVSNFNTSFAPNREDRTSGGLSMDFKPWEHSVFKVNLQASAQKQQSASRALNYNVGGKAPVDWDAHHTTGNAAGGSVGISTSFQERHALTRTVGASWLFNTNDWDIELAGTYSNANNRTRDIDKGFFRTISVQLPAATSVSLADIDTSQARFGAATVRDASGQAVDELSLANWRLTQAANASEPMNAVDDVKEARLNVLRKFSLGRTPLNVKFGGSVNDQKRDLDYKTLAMTFVGADGIPNSSDDYLANYVSAADRGVSPGFGRPAPEWPDPFAIYQTWKQHPSWWQLSDKQAGDSAKNAAIRSPWFHEKVSAAYLMADTQLLHDRVRLVGGVRVEKTEDEGRGYMQDPDATYLHDAQGNVVFTTNNKGVRSPVINPAMLPTSGFAYNNAMYKYRGYYNSRKYTTYHPSVAGTFNLTENLLLRAAFAKTIGRPNLSDIVPNLYVGENINYGVPGVGGNDVPGYIVGANTGLKPWTAKNYDYSLEYYLPHNGLVMFNVFRKDIRDFFSNYTEIADQALLDTLGLPESALGYQYSKKINVSDARITGWEARIDFPLANLADWGPLVAPLGKSWARHFTLMANATHLDLSGSRITSSDWKRYIPRSRNFGVRWAFPKLSGNLLVNWRGRMLRDSSSSFAGANEYIRARYQVDASTEYQLTKHFSVFFAVRNLLNAPSEWEVSGPGAPAWATLTNYEDYGAQYSLGVRAVF